MYFNLYVIDVNPTAKNQAKSAKGKGIHIEWIISQKVGKIIGTQEVKESSLPAGRQGFE